MENSLEYLDPENPGKQGTVKRKREFECVVESRYPPRRLGRHFCCKHISTTTTDENEFMGLKRL